METAKYILFLFTVTWTLSLNAQTLSGTTGLLNTPSAEMQPDGTFMMGYNYLPAINQPAINIPTSNYYFNLTFLPFLELAYKCTFLKMENNRYSNQDRSANIRLQLFKEKKILPALTAGIHDAYTSVEGKGNQYYGAAYIAMTKNFPISGSSFSLTTGYGFQVLRHNQLTGLFGGFSFSPAICRLTKWMAEYDTQGINIGGSILLFKHFYLFSMLEHYRYFAGGAAYKIELK